MLITIALLAATVLGPVRADTVRREDVVRELGLLIQSDTVPGPPGEGTVRVVGFNADARQALPLLGEFVRVHGRLLWYMATHTPGAEARMLPLGADPQLARDSIRTALSSNDAFMKRTMQMLAQYWAPRGRVVAGVSTTSPTVSIALSKLSTLGARFFYPDRFSESGDIMFTHICAGVNGLADLPGGIDPVTEAFVFVAISQAAFTQGSALMRDYETAARRAKLVSASKDTSTRIKRAQGALWMQLEQSPALTRAIQKAYALNAVVLPFHLAASQ